MNNSQVVVKFPAEVKNVVVSFADVLIGGEVIISGAIGTSVPPGLTVSALSHTTDSVTLQVGAGTDHQSYGVSTTVNTDGGHVYTKVVSAVMNSDLATNYQNTNVQAFNQLVGKLEAGSAALGRANFMFPAGFNASSGVITWELIDTQGIVYAQGQAYDYQAQTVAQGTKVEAQAVVNAPSNMLPTLDGQSYQVRWILTINAVQYYSFESLEVTGLSTVPIGTEDTVEMSDATTFHVSMVSQLPYDRVNVDVYRGNERVVAAIAANATKTSEGWQYTVELTNTGLAASLEPYTLIWNSSNTGRPNNIDRQTARLFLVNASMMQATEDMRIVISKSRATIFGTNDILFTVPLLLSYLRRGRDAFNIAYGMFTGFTMLNAMGGIREYWLKFSEIMALRSQYLAEGEKVFNLSGQAISLDVDRTQYYSQLADNIQQQLDNEGKVIKQNLIKKGITGGDGDVTNLSLSRFGAMGTVSITITPATNGWGRGGLSRGMQRF